MLMCQADLGRCVCVCVGGGGVQALKAYFKCGTFLRGQACDG